MLRWTETTCLVCCLQQVHARENEDVVAAVLSEAQELGFELAVRAARRPSGPMKYGRSNF